MLALKVTPKGVDVMDRAGEGGVAGVEMRALRGIITTAERDVLDLNGRIHPTPRPAGWLTTVVWICLTQPFMWR